MRAMIAETLLQYGQPFSIYRGAERVGGGIGYKVAKDRVITFYPDVAVFEGDWIADDVSKAQYYVTESERVFEEGEHIATRAYYENQAEYEQRKAASRPPTTSIQTGDFYGPANINTGTQRDLSFSGTYAFDFRSIEQEIEQRGGADAEELRQALDEIRDLIESGGTIRPGILARFGRAIKENDWFSTHVGREIVEYLAQNLPGA